MARMTILGSVMRWIFSRQVTFFDAIMLMVAAGATLSIAEGLIFIFVACVVSVLCEMRWGDAE